MLGDAMEDEVCFQSMRRHSRCSIDQFFLLFLQHIVCDTALAIPLN
jgi:hypothetical protein